MISHPEVTVFKMKGVRSGEVFRAIIDDILLQDRCLDWTKTCTPVSSLSMPQSSEHQDVVLGGALVVMITEKSDFCFL